MANTFEHERIAMIKPEVVDQVLGAGHYERWQKIQDAFIEEQTRAYKNEERFSSAWAKNVRTQLQADLAFAERIHDDYLALLERISARGTATVTEGEKILDVFVLAISVLTSVNDVLDDMFALGIVSLSSGRWSPLVWRSMPEHSHHFSRSCNRSWKRRNGRPTRRTCS